MNLYSKLVRRLSPARFVRMNINRLDRDIRNLKGTWPRKRTVEEHNEIARLVEDQHEFLEWQQEIDDKALARKAAKVGVYLVDIEFISEEDETRNYGRYYYSGTFGNELFRFEFRKPLLKAVRDRLPIYRKERREVIGLYVSLLTAFTGAIGALIGLLSVFSKWRP